MKARARLSAFSKPLLDEMIQAERINAFWQKRGALKLFKTPEKMAAYQSIARVLKETVGISGQPLEGSRLREREPAISRQVHGAWYYDCDAHLRPDLLIGGLKDRLIKSGVQITEDCKINSIEARSSKKASVSSKSNEFTARCVIVATGAWAHQTAKMAGFHLPLQPAKGYSITMAPPRRCPKIPCFFTEEKVVATAWENGFRLGGRLELNGFDATKPNRVYAHMKQVAAAYLQDPVGPTIETWTGLRPLCADDLPVIGPIPGMKNIYAAAGHGMTGLTTAAGTGKLIAECISGRRPGIDMAPYNPVRFYKYKN
jgi:D-amino-acid dehydrogenase